MGVTRLTSDDLIRPCPAAATPRQDNPTGEPPEMSPPPHNRSPPPRPDIPSHATSPPCKRPTTNQNSTRSDMDLLGLVSDQALNLGLSLLFVVLIFAVRYLILRTITARVKDTKAAFKVRKLSFYISVGLALVTLTGIWTSQLAGAGSFISILSAGVAIALSGVLKNMAGWLLIIFRRPFKVGDRIEVGPDASDVIDIGVFRFSLQEIRNWVDADQTTGRILHIPNGVVFDKALANYTEGFPYIWNEIPVTVTFESDWEKAHDMIQTVIERYTADPQEVTAAGERAANRYFGLYQTLEPAVYVKAIDFGVTITGRVLGPVHIKLH